jgi:undecaprenyl diphosphate synthase
MDGNNRWSIKNKVSKFEAYRKGSKNLLQITEYLFDNYDLNFVSAFALSSNNLKRDAKLIKILKKVFKYFLDDLYNGIQKNYSVEIIGDLSFLDKSIILKTQDYINNQKKMKNKLILFINYGGQEDIENASKSLSTKKTENFKITNFLSTNKFPNPDILLRSGGFQRLSNFMLYEIAFTEFFFSKKLWPDIKKTDLKRIIKNYYNIERKFGI